jgi:hypothetical protein
VHTEFRRGGYACRGHRESKWEQGRWPKSQYRGRIGFHGYGVDGRFAIRKAMSMVVQEMLREKPGWRLPPMAIPQSMSVSRIFLAKVVLRFCRMSLIVGHAPGGYKTVELDVDIGSSAFDYAALQKNEVHRLKVRITNDRN